MPPLSRSVDDIARRRHKWIQPFDGKGLLATHDNPNLGKVRMVVPQITWGMFRIRSVSTDDIRMGTIFSNSEIAPRSASLMLFLQRIDIEE